jgi:hypothetical protein
VGGGKKTEKRKEVAETFDTQGFAVFRLFSVCFPFVFRFYGGKAVFYGKLSCGYIRACFFLFDSPCLEVGV